MVNFEMKKSSKKTGTSEENIRSSKIKYKVRKFAGFDRSRRSRRNEVETKTFHVPVLFRQRNNCSSIDPRKQCTTLTSSILEPPPLGVALASGFGRGGLSGPWPIQTSHKSPLLGDTVPVFSLDPRGKSRGAAVLRSLSSLKVIILPCVNTSTLPSSSPA